MPSLLTLKQYTFHLFFFVFVSMCTPLWNSVIFSFFLFTCKRHFKTMFSALAIAMCTFHLFFKHFLLFQSVRYFETVCSFHLVSKHFVLFLIKTAYFSTVFQKVFFCFSAYLHHFELVLFNSFPNIFVFVTPATNKTINILFNCQIFSVVSMHAPFCTNMFFRLFFKHFLLFYIQTVCFIFFVFETFPFVSMYAQFLISIFNLFTIRI